MGYTVYRSTKDSMVNDIKRENPDVTAWSLVGNQLWGLVPFSTLSIERSAGMYKKGDQYIILFKLESCGDGEWGYKVMDEGCHPYYYTCPKKFLSKAVVLNEDWRKNVLEHHAKKAKKASLRFALGDIISLVNCSVKQVEITSVSPLMGIDVASGKLYKIPKKFIAA